MADIAIRTTITANSIQRLFGPPGSLDYRTHPSQREPDAPSMIFKSMKLKEVPPVADIKCLKGTVYSFKNRKIVTRWLRDVCGAFHLKLTTLCLAVQLCDAYIMKNLDRLPVSKCQLAGVAAMWIAAKFEEMDDFPPWSEVVTPEHPYYWNYIRERRVPEDLANYLYLYLHMHGDSGIVTTLTKSSDVGLAAPSVLPNTLTAILLTIDENKSRRTLSISIQLGGAALAQTIPQIVALLKLPGSKASSVELFELFGQEFMVARRLNLADSASACGWTATSRVTIFASTTGNTAGSTIFSERNSLVILRSVNGLCIHVCETLAQEAVTHVEFLRLPSHIVALGVLALGRAMTGTCLTETRSAVTYLLKSLELSGALALAAADLLADKYKESFELGGGSLPPPVVPLPEDIQDRIKFVFSKNAAAQE